MAALQTSAIDVSQLEPQVEIVPLVNGLYPLDVNEGAGYRIAQLAQRDVRISQVHWSCLEFNAKNSRINLHCRSQ